MLSERICKPLLLLVWLAGFALQADASSRQQLQARMDMMERMDRMELLDGLEQANECTRQRKFSCADTQLKTVKPLVNSTDDQRMFSMAMNNLQREKAQAEQELKAQQQAERERQQRIEREAREARWEEENRRALLAAIAGVAGGSSTGGSNQRLQQIANDHHRQLEQNYQQALRQQQEQRQREQAERTALQQRQQMTAEANARQRQLEQERIQQRQSETEQRQQAEREKQARELQLAAERKRQEEAQAARQQKAQAEKTYRNSGERAMHCVSLSDNNGTISVSNSCAVNIFLIYCGDFKYSNKRCGDGPSGAYYTHSKNVYAGETVEMMTINSGGRYAYGACTGGISFGNMGEFTDRPDGSFTCHKR